MKIPQRRSSQNLRRCIKFLLSRNQSCLRFRCTNLFSLFVIALQPFLSFVAARLRVGEVIRACADDLLLVIRSLDTLVMIDRLSFLTTHFWSHLEHAKGQFHTFLL